MDLVVVEPSECSEAALGEFGELVRSEGQVNEAGLERRIRAAKALIFLRDAGALAGVAAIKHPDDHYREDVFHKAGVRAEAGGFELELGWIVVAVAYRGRGLTRDLVSAAIETARKPLFATSREGNERIHKTLRRYGFVQVGSPYPGIAEGEVVLFTRPRD